MLFPPWYLAIDASIRRDFHGWICFIHCLRDISITIYIPVSHTILSVLLLKTEDEEEDRLLPPPPKVAKKFSTALISKIDPITGTPFILAAAIGKNCPNK